MKKIFMLIFIFYTLLLNGVVFAEETSADLLYKYGFISGNNGNLMLSKPLTRAEVAVLIVELKGEKEAAANFALPSSFKDIDSTKWYAPYVSYGQTYGYLGGYPDNTFKPDKAVTAQEFAAFMMNVLAYNGDYDYKSVLQFSDLLGVHVAGKNGSFVRSDAFNAMWEVVNLPVKGSEISIGNRLGKLNTTVSDPQVQEVFGIKVNSTKSIEVKFEKPVEAYERVSFKIRRQVEFSWVNEYLDVKWNSTKNTVELTSNIPLPIGNYEVTLYDAIDGTPKVVGPFNVNVKKEEVASIKLDSLIVLPINETTGTVGFTVYNQYDEDITTSDLAKSLVFSTSTDVPTPTVDFNAGIITIKHNDLSHSGITIKNLPQIFLAIAYPPTGYVFDSLLHVSQQGLGITGIRINGIVNENDDLVDFIYDLDKDYYLDVSLYDSLGREIRDQNTLDGLSGGNQEAILVQCSNSSLISVEKVTHPKRTNEIAFKLSISASIEADTPLFFTAQSPIISSGKNSTNYFTTLKISK